MSAPFTVGQKVTVRTKAACCSRCSSADFQFNGPHPMEPETVGMFRCEGHGGHPRALPYASVTLIDASETALARPDYEIGGAR